MDNDALHLSFGEVNENAINLTLQYKQIPNNNNKTMLAVRKVQCECDHCRVSDFDECPHESEVGKFIYTTISEEARA